MSTLEKQYHQELKLELEGAQYPAVPSEVEDMDAEENALSHLKQVADDESNMSKALMSRKKRKLLEAMEVRMSTLENCIIRYTYSLHFGGLLLSF